jgi:signal peptidase II
MTPARAPITRFGYLAYALACATVVLDQLSKLWVVDVYHLPEKMSVRVLPVFSLSMVWNRGVSYGFLTAHDAVGRWGLVLFSVAVAAGLAWWARHALRAIPAIGVGLVIGGAIGNAIDRARIGSVVDFLDFSGLHFPWVFNIADSGITVGVILLLLDNLAPRQPQKA